MTKLREKKREKDNQSIKEEISMADQGQRERGGAEGEARRGE